MWPDEFLALVELRPTTLMERWCERTISCCSISVDVSNRSSAMGWWPSRNHIALFNVHVEASKRLLYFSYLNILLDPPSASSSIPSRFPVDKPDGLEETNAQDVLTRVRLRVLPWPDCSILQQVWDITIPLKKNVSLFRSQQLSAKWKVYKAAGLPIAAIACSYFLMVTRAKALALESGIYRWWMSEELENFWRRMETRYFKDIKPYHILPSNFIL